MKKKIFNKIATYKNLYKKEFISKDTTDKVLKKFHSSKKAFSIYDITNKKILTFIKVNNPITNKTIGMLIIKSKSVYIHNKTNNFYIALIISLLLLSIVLMFIYVELKHKKDVDETNKKIAKSNKELSTVLKEAESGIALVDLDGKFLKINQMYIKVLGYSISEFRKLSCYNLVLIDQLDNLKQIFKTAYDEGSVSKERIEFISKSKKIIHLEFSLTLLPSKDAFIAVINCLEDKLKLEYLNNNLQKEVDSAVENLIVKDRLLSQQSKMAAMGEMIDSIGHQWVQPISIIKMKLQTLEMDIEYDTLTNERIIETIHNSNSQIDHLINTIDEFRTFFRPNSQLEKILLKELLDSSILLIKDELIKNTIQTNITGDTNSIVEVYSSEFKHVIINIINNAKDAFIENDTKNRKISFDIEKTMTKIKLRISDNAGGIPSNVIKHIFEPHFTTKGDKKGTGVGLYMSKQIIDKVGATIDVYNTSNGATFEISIENKA